MPCELEASASIVETKKTQPPRPAVPAFFNTNSKADEKFKF